MLFWNVTFFIHSDKLPIWWKQRERTFGWLTGEDTKVLPEQVRKLCVFSLIKLMWKNWKISVKYLENYCEKPGKDLENSLKKTWKMEWIVLYKPCSIQIKRALIVMLNNHELFGYFCTLVCAYLLIYFFVPMCLSIWFMSKY